MQQRNTHQQNNGDGNAENAAGGRIIQTHRNYYMEQVKKAEAALYQFTSDELTDEDKTRLVKDINNLKSLILTTNDETAITAGMEKITETLERIRKNYTEGNMDIRNERLQQRLHEMNVIASELCAYNVRMQHAEQKYAKKDPSPKKKKHGLFTRSLPQPLAIPIEDESQERFFLLGKKSPEK